MTVLQIVVWARDGRIMLPVIISVLRLIVQPVVGLEESIRGTKGDKMSWAFKQHPRRLGYIDYRNKKSDFRKAEVLLKAKLSLDLSLAESYSCNERALFQGIELYCVFSNDVEVPNSKVIPSITTG